MTIVDLIRRVRHVPALEKQDWLWGALRRPYRAVLGRAARRRGIARTVNGELLRLKPPFHEVANDYEEAPFTAFRAAVFPGAVVLDVGASFGLYSIGAARRGAAVVAFEPGSGTAGLLREHLRLNGVPQVEVVDAAVTDSDGRQEFWEQATSLGASLSRAAAEAGAPFVEGRLVAREVRALTLDAFCEERGSWPDVVKIDVEGAEARVLRGATRLLGRHHGAIFLEVHPWALEQLGDSADATLALLEDANWTAELLGTDGNTAHYVCRPGLS